MATEAPIQLNAGAGGDKVAAYLDAAGNKHQQLILEFYTGSGDPTLVSSAAPLPVSVGTALPSGTNSIGSVAQGGTWTVNIGTIAAGAGIIGAVNQGTPPWSVVGNVQAGSLDAGAGVKIAGLFTSAPPTYSNGQRGDIQIDTNGNLKVNIVAGAAAGGTSATVGNATPSQATLAAASDGTNLRALLVDGGGNLKINVAAGGVPASTDNSAFTAGTGQGLPYMGLYNDGLGAVTSGAAAVPRITANRQMLVALQAAVNGGWTPFQLVSAATTNATAVKTSPGVVGYITAFNLNAAARYVKLFNKASAPTPGTDTPLQTFMVPGNTAGSGFTIAIPAGINFTTGIGMCIVSGMDAANAGAVGATEVVVSLGYL